MMNIEDLNAKLVEAYSEQNLNKITLTLLNLYKEQQFGILNKIADMISDCVSIEIDAQGKGFSKLMMLYHPDRGDFHRKSIAGLFAQGNYDALLEFSHILKLMHLEEIATTIESFEDIDYSPVYEWDVQGEGFIRFSEKRRKTKEVRNKKSIKHLSFYDAFRIRIYGHTKIEVPVYHFQDMDEIELSEAGIDHLEGLELCKQAVSIDLSGNRISDLTELWELTMLEELNLSDNRITEIDPLSDLSNLRALNLSNNRISDLSPLLGLNKLELLIVSGNPVNQNHVDELRGLGVEVEME